MKFIIYHLGNHYIAYCKIQNDWYYFNDMNSSFASKENPPLKGENGSNTYPVAIYYVLKKWFYFINIINWFNFSIIKTKISLF